jgi:3'-5' exoribonuclease 1
LQSLDLNSQGHKDKLKKRLKDFLKEPSKANEQALEIVSNQENKGALEETYFGCLDFEATCDQDSSFDYPNQIIEFPLVLLNSKGDIVDEFHSFVKPTEQLSQFCIELTGISQVC